MLVDAAKFHICGINKLYLVDSYDLDDSLAEDAEEDGLLVLALAAARLASSDDKPSPFSRAPTASKPASYSSSNRLLKPAWQQ